MTVTKKIGLSANNKNLITTLLVIVLLTWGPFELYGSLFRIAYLILLPIIVWWFLNSYGPKWNIDKLQNNYINKIIWAIIAIVLLIIAINTYNKKYHSECSEYTRTRDDIECAGDYTTEAGPDMFIVFIMGAGSLGAGWYAVSERKNNN